MDNRTLLQQQHHESRFQLDKMEAWKAQLEALSATARNGALPSVNNSVQRDTFFTAYEYLVAQLV
jgi:hypothetical protein